MYTCILDIYTYNIHMHTHMYNIYIYTYTHIYIHIHIYMYVYMYIHMMKDDVRTNANVEPTAFLGQFMISCAYAVAYRYRCL